MSHRLEGLTPDILKAGGTIFHPDLGTISVTVRRGGHTFRAGWKNGRLAVSIPAGGRVESFSEAFGRLLPRLVASRPQLLLDEAHPIVCPGLEIRFRPNPRIPSGLVATPQLPVTYVEYHPSLTPSAESLSRISARIAGALAEQLLLPRARELAASVGANPAGWRIGRGHKVLGTCSSARIITLSSMVVFLTQELRDYIVYHELAHLTEMNHSPRFHAICNRYCSGREAALRRALLAYPWPLLK